MLMASNNNNFILAKLCLVVHQICLVQLSQNVIYNTQYQLFMTWSVTILFILQRNYKRILGENCFICRKLQRMRELRNKLSKVWDLLSLQNFGLFHRTFEYLILIMFVICKHTIMVIGLHYSL